MRAATHLSGFGYILSPFVWNRSDLLMLMITSFTNPRVAQAFVDYMATQGVILTIQQHTRSDVWLSDEAQEARVRSELERFLANPADPRYLAASWQSGQTNSGLHYRHFPFLATLKAGAGPVTMVIMAVCVLVFILMNIVGDQPVILACLAVR